MNTAIERHVRSCARCKREGLRNAASERKGSLRQLRSVRGGKPLLGRRGRNWIIFLTTVLLLQVVIYQVANGKAGAFVSLFSRSGPQVSLAGDTTPPISLSSANAFPLVTSGATAIALSPDDKQLAVAGGDSQHNITIWDISTQKPATTLQWSDSTPPGALAWSADGSMLAAADGAQVNIWTVANGASVWQFPLPAAPAMRVYDVSQQGVVSRPDPANAFNAGALAWGSDGALNSAPGGALGPADISKPQSPVVGMWTSAGSHIFAGSGGAAMVGTSDADAKAGATLIDWAPDGRFLLWGALSRGIALNGAQPTNGQSSPPDSVVGELAARVGHAGAGAEALVWFGPLGKLVAVCDKSTPGAHVQIIEISTGHVKYQLGETCASLTVHSAVWSSTGATFYITSAKDPVAVYNIGAK